MRLVHPDAVRFDRPPESWWEASASPLGLDLPPLAGERRFDVAIIGGGFAGLCAAIELARLGVAACVLEAGPVGWGASGRNGGFACIGSHKRSWESLVREFGMDETRAFHSAMRQSVELVAENCREFGIDARSCGEGEITLAHLPNRMEELRQEQAFLREAFGEETTLLPGADLAALGLSGPHFHGGLMGRRGFGLHPLEYVRGLARAAVAAGVPVFPLSQVVRWEEDGGTHRLFTATGSVSAGKVLVATNGYTPERLSARHAGRILPALSNILVTRPLSDGELHAQGWTSHTMAYDSRNLLHYFRLLPDNRFLFGGRGGTDSSDAAASAYRARLTASFHRLFPAWREVETTHFWRGFVCLSRDLVPYLGPLDEARSVWTALAWHGNGVAFGSWAGRAVARMMTGTAAPGEIPAIVTRRLTRFPLPFLRPAYLKGAYAWFAMKDAR